MLTRVCRPDLDKDAPRGYKYKFLHTARGLLRSLFRISNPISERAGEPRFGYRIARFGRDPTTAERDLGTAVGVNLNSRPMNYKPRETRMSGEDSTDTIDSQENVEPGPAQDEQAPDGMDEDKEAEPLVSAKDIPRPEIMMETSPGMPVLDLKVCLTRDPISGTSFQEIAKVNSDPDTDSRTPLMTVILAVLANAGGKMTVKDLTEQVRTHWNRPMPAGPYTPEEFVYVVARDSDRITISE